MDSVVLLEKKITLQCPCVQRKSIISNPNAAMDRVKSTFQHYDPRDDGEPDVCGGFSVGGVFKAQTWCPVHAVHLCDRATCRRRGIHHWKEGNNMILTVYPML